MLKKLMLIKSACILKQNLLNNPAEHASFFSI